MPTPAEHFPLPLDLLIGRLEAAGFRVDTSRRLRMLRVFDDLGNPFVGGHFEELKYLLSPLVSRSPQEQERFYEVFEAFWKECEAEAERVEEATGFAEGENVADSVQVLAKPKKRWWVWIVAFGVVSSLIFLSTFDIRLGYRNSLIKSPPLSVAEGEILQIEAVKNTQSYWEIKDLESRTTLHLDTGELSWKVIGGYGRTLLLSQKIIAPKFFRDVVEQDSFQIKILCSNPPKVSEITPSAQPPYQPDTEYEFSIKTEPGCRVVWDYYGAAPPDTLTVGATGICTFRLKTGAPGTSIELHAIVHRPEKIGYCYTERNFTIDLGNDKPILQFAEFQRDDSFSVFVISRLGWLLIALPLLPALWFFWRWRKKRNTPAPQKTPEELAAEYPIVDAGPYFIPYLPQEHNITVPREFFRIAELLRRREEGQRRYFDGPATVRATIESGGFPAWRERAVTRPAEYLFLVERPDERAQQGKLFARLCDFMKRRDVPMIAFFHDGSFGHFWNSEYSNGLPPAELRRRYPHHRLVLLGAAHGLVNPYATRQPELLREPLDWLTNWPRRLLLSPEPVAAWSFQEALLHRHFLVFPADTEGILSGIDLLDRTEEYQPGRFERWQENRAPRHSAETHRYRTWKTATDHADYLCDDPDCYRWLCALAVCAQPDWSLTLAIGRAIGVEVTHDRLLRLTRIPWLSSNQPNDGLRLELLRQLSPDDEQAARAAVAHELEAVHSMTSGSFADTERAANAAVQNFALDPRDEAHKQTIRELRTLGLLSGSQEAELDFIVQEKADKSGLPNSAGAGIASWLDVPAPKKFWTWDMRLGVLSLLLSLTLLAVLINREKPLPRPFEGLIKDVTQNEELIQLNEQAIAIAERVLDIENYETWQGSQDDVQLADSLFQILARAYGRIIDTSGNLIFQQNLVANNIFRHRYNISAKNFNFYQTNSLASEALRAPLLIFEWAGNNAEITLNIFNNKGTPLSFMEKNLMLDARHGQGLCYYYLSKQSPEQNTLLDSARLVYNLILSNSDSLYFENIREQMPVNLETLLQAEKEVDKSDTVDADEEIRGKIVGYWMGEWKGDNQIVIFRKSGAASFEKYDTENNLEETLTLKWTIENGNLGLTLVEGAVLSKILYVDNQQITIRRSQDGETVNLRRIQPTDRDGDRVLDVVDNCPDEKGIPENGGCPEEEVPSSVEKDIEEKFRLGKSAFEDGRLNDARILLESVIANSTTEIKQEAEDLLAKIYSFQGNFNKAEALLSRIINLTEGCNDRTAKNLILHSEIKIDLGKRAEAKELLRYAAVDCDGATSKTKALALENMEKLDKLIEREGQLEQASKNNNLLSTVTLYFDNAKPTDQNTQSQTTTQAYRDLFMNFYRRKEEYIKQYTAGLGKGDNIGEATAEMENFFERDVRGGWEKLFDFSETIYEMLERGDKIEIALRAYTSPRGNPLYNMNLSSRRISSVVNHFLTFDGGKKYVDSGQLTFKQEPLGESEAPKNVSDDEKDHRNSYYSPKALRENRVEIIGVQVEK